MTVPVPHFDAALMLVLADEAANAGETVDTFVSRAVAARLVQLIASKQDPAVLSALRSRLAANGLAPQENHELTVVADPERLRVLAQTGLLDAPRDESYDRIVAMAADALTVPTAAISLVDADRQFLFSTAGITGELAETRETSLDRSICQYVVETGEPLIVEDAREHPVLMDHPSVMDKSLLAYAGMPLTNSAGHSIGTLCVWDNTPRHWSVGHVQILRDLAEFVRDRVFNTVAH